MKRNSFPLLHKNKVILSLGSNLGSRQLSLQRGVERLKKVLEKTKTSSIYETSPVDSNHNRRQPSYYNIVVSGYTDWSPEKIHKYTQEIETVVTGQAIAEGFPFQKKRDKGPRYLDIDIIFFGKKVISTSNLRIPHPSYHERLFVLIPLLEIEPNKTDPVTGKKISEQIKKKEINFPDQKWISLGKLMKNDLTNK